MTVNRLLRVLLNVKDASVADFDLEEHNGTMALTVHVHLYKRDKWRCSVCGRKCPVHDYACDEAFWRGMDFGPVRVVVGSRVPRGCCSEHGVLTAAVPWAKPGSRFTLDFAYSVTWMVKSGLNRSLVAERMGINWKTVGRLVELMWHERESDVKKRFDNLRKIGIDETSYRKGLFFSNFPVAPMLRKGSHLLPQRTKFAPLHDMLQHHFLCTYIATKKGR